MLNIMLVIIKGDGMVNFLKFVNRGAYAFRFKFDYDKIGASNEK
jgi:hypothetical protein